MKILKRLKAALSVLFVVILSTALMVACKTEEATLEDISLQGYKTEFASGEEFSVGDLVVKAEYSNGKTKTVDAYTIDSAAYNKDAVGTYTVRCSYTENDVTKSSEYVVEVVDDSAVTAIEVTGQELYFNCGTEFSLGDGVITRVYLDGVKVVTQHYQIDSSEYDANTVGAYEIVISIGDNRYTYTVHVEEIKVLKMLMIGNSYSDDTAWYIPDIATALRYDEIEVGVLYIGGCTLQMHYANSQSELAKYEFRYYENGAWNEKYDGELKTLEFGIKFKDWDFITMQQASMQSGVVGLYDRYLTGVVEYVKEKATNPNMQLVWNMTWAYANDYPKMQLGYADQLTMYRQIVSVVEGTIEKNADFMAISPAGTAIQNARTSVLGDTLNRDGTHLSLDVGRYIAAMSMFCTLTNCSVDDITYAPSGLDETKIAIAKESVRNALNNKYEITESQYE